MCSKPPHGGKVCHQSQWRCHFEKKRSTPFPVALFLAAGKKRPLPERQTVPRPISVLWICDGIQISAQCTMRRKTLGKVRRRAATTALSALTRLGARLMGTSLELRSRFPKVCSLQRLHVARTLKQLVRRKKILEGVLKIAVQSTTRRDQCRALLDMPQQLTGGVVGQQNGVVPRKASQRGYRQPTEDVPGSGAVSLKPAPQLLKPKTTDGSSQVIRNPREQTKQGGPAPKKARVAMAVPQNTGEEKCEEHGGDTTASENMATPQALALLRALQTAPSTASIATSYEGMYGENRVSCLAYLCEVLRRYFFLDQSSVFLDIGSGRGLPNLVVSFLGHVRASLGIEIDSTAYHLSLRTLSDFQSLIFQHCMDAGVNLWSRSKNCAVCFECVDAVLLQSFDPATHIFSFDLAMPPFMIDRFVDLFNTSATAFVFITFRKDLADFSIDAEPICQIPMEMVVSSEKHRATIYLKRSHINRFEEALQEKNDTESRKGPESAVLAPHPAAVPVDMNKLRLAAQEASTNACTLCGGLVRQTQQTRQIVASERSLMLQKLAGSRSSKRLQSLQDVATSDCRQGDDASSAVGTMTYWVRCDACKLWRTLPNCSANEYAAIQGLPVWTCSLNYWDKTQTQCGVAVAVEQHTANLASDTLYWAQCDLCEKWRALPGCSLDDYNAVQESPRWTCSMNVWDPSRASCAVPEADDANAEPLLPITTHTEEQSGQSDTQGIHETLTGPSSYHTGENGTRQDTQGATLYLPFNIPREWAARLEADLRQKTRASTEVPLHTHWQEGPFNVIFSTPRIENLVQNRLLLYLKENGRRLPWDSGKSIFPSHSRMSPSNTEGYLLNRMTALCAMPLVFQMEYCHLRLSSWLSEPSRPARRSPPTFKPRGNFSRFNHSEFYIESRSYASCAPIDGDNEENDGETKRRRHRYLEDFLKFKWKIELEEQRRCRAAGEWCLCPIHALRQLLGGKIPFLLPQQYLVIATDSNTPSMVAEKKPDVFPSAEA